MPTGAITDFTPWTALAGGVLIGVSAVMVMALLGRIAGISGITSGVLQGRGDWGWRLAFIVGLVVAPLPVAMVHAPAVSQTLPDSLLAMALAGLLVGFGTVWGSGCTSGHGVCGIARLSPRSLVAVAVFMAAGFATVFVLRHVIA